MYPRLVVTSGYPSSGKSTISNYMQDELGFFRIGTDDLRQELYGQDYGQISDEGKLGQLKENIMFNTLYLRKLPALLRGSDTIVDCTAPNNSTRRTLLNTDYYEDRIPAEKYLLFLRVGREELIKREELKRGTAKSIYLWDRSWEEPENNSVGYGILMYDNNTESDMKHIFADLRKLFMRDKKLWIPV